MATIKWWLLSAIAIALLVGQGSCGPKFLDIFTEDERESCVNADCSNKPSCSTSAQCTAPKKCCIDVVHNRACCHSLGEPTNPPPTSSPTPSANPPTNPPPATNAPVIAPTTSAANSSPSTPAITTAAAVATTPGSLPFCGDLGQHPECSDNQCPCTSDADCFQEEICCIDTNLTPSLQCHLLTPATTTPASTTPQDPANRCPTSIPDPECIPGLATIAPDENDTCDEDHPCRAGEVCCTINRDSDPCCVKLP